MPLLSTVGFSLSVFLYIMCQNISSELFTFVAARSQRDLNLLYLMPQLPSKIAIYIVLLCYRIFFIDICGVKLMKITETGYFGGSERGRKSKKEQKIILKDKKDT
jgi:hypothetical protein